MIERVQYSRKRQVWSLAISLGLLLLSIAAFLSLYLLPAAGLAALAVGFWYLTRVWTRQDPIPMPYFMRGLLWLPRGPHSTGNLARILEPRSGERILEVGPGIGTHALPMAAAVLPRGILDVLDIQAEMLGALKKRARKLRVTNIEATQGNAETLPYPDGFFDAAYMIDTLGEIPDGAAALRELARVLKPTGRLVIGEIMIDPDFIPLTALKGKARPAGFVFERMTGSRIAYFALFRRHLPGGVL